MEEDYQELLTLLKNQGFPEPEKWVDYARKHHFKRVRAEKLGRCPDCGNASDGILGHYVYYSHFMTLMKCHSCGLVYVDKRLDSDLMNAHFEHAYKEERYFLESRRLVFEQVAELVKTIAPADGSVIDVGGAKGHLMAALKVKRPDLDLTVNDVSPTACSWCQSKYGFKTICGAASALETHGSYNVALMIDVLYYEPKIAEVWRLLPILVSDGGTAVIRIPNNVTLVKLYRLWLRLVARPEARGKQVGVKPFNPEHLYLFSRQYFLDALKKIGFEHTVFLPGQLLKSSGSAGFLRVLYYRLCQLIYLLSWRKLILTPSFLIVTRKINDGT